MQFMIFWKIESFNPNQLYKLISVLIRLRNDSNSIYPNKLSTNTYINSIKNNTVP